MMDASAVRRMNNARSHAPGEEKMSKKKATPSNKTALINKNRATMTFFSHHHSFLSSRPLPKRQKRNPNDARKTTKTIDISLQPVCDRSPPETVAPPAVEEEAASLELPWLTSNMVLKSRAESWGTRRGVK